jgi:phosphoenolpyruvate carboxykinase (GTP)
MASETTAAATGAVGVVRRDPMAMRPFVGYNMGDYFNHWIEMGKNIKNQPKIFNVNWFRTDDNGNFIWPGFGDNMRVLEWIIDRCEDKVGAVESPIGYLPYPEDICIDGLDDVTIDTVRELLMVDKASWLDDVENIKAFYKQVGERMPTTLYNELAELEERLKG